MQETNLLLFLAASLVVIVAPGPDNILVLSRGVTLGRKSALVSAAGASTGLVCHSLFAAAGLSALLAQSALAFSVIKYVGAVYLIYLGVRALLDRERFVLSEGASPIGLKSVYVQAVASNILNPKIAVFSWRTCRSLRTRPHLRHPNCWGSAWPSRCSPGCYSALSPSSRVAWEGGSGADRNSRAAWASSREAC